MKCTSTLCRRGLARRTTFCSIRPARRSRCCCLRGGSLRAAWSKKQHDRGGKRERCGEVERSGGREALPEPSGEQAGEERGDAGDEVEEPEGVSAVLGHDRVRDQSLQHRLRERIVEPVEA